MEAVGSAAAVLQLVQTIGKTVISVSQAYHDIRDMDDTLRDFDSQISATEMLLSILSDAIRSNTSGPSTPPWWNQTALEGILNSYSKSYSRLNTIFVEISRQRSSAAALRAYMRKKLYDSDISHLRLSIDTYTSALQLPVLIHTIQGSTPAILQPPTGGVDPSYEQLMHRINNLQSSMDRLDSDLVTRALRRTDRSVLASPQSGSSHDIQAGLDAAKGKEKIDMENDTRATLGVLKGLVGRAKDYATTIESASTSSRFTQSVSQARIDYRDAVGAVAVRASRPYDFPNPAIDYAVQLSPNKRQDVSDWAGNVVHGGNFTSASVDSSLPPFTVTSQSALSTSTKGTSVLFELQEKRIQAAEKFMKEKMFKEAIPHLERLLSPSSGPESGQDTIQSARSLAKALVQSSSDDSTVESYCQKFPSIRTWVDEYRLERGLYLLRQRRYDEVIALLRSYEKSPGSPRGGAESVGRYIRLPEHLRSSPRGQQSSPTRSASSKTCQKIQITLCRALLRSPKSNGKGETIAILKRLLQRNCLDPAEKGETLWLLAEAYCLKGNFEDAKSHGIKACQLKMNTLGRDHEETVACITLMADICLITNDPDEDLWGKMLSRSKPTNDGVDVPPPRFTESQNRITSCNQRMQRLGAINPKLAAEYGVKYLKENYCLISSPDMQDSELTGCRCHSPCSQTSLSKFLFGEGLLCWDCLGQHLAKTHTFAAIQVGAACPRHRFGQSTGFTGLSPFHFFAIAIPRLGKWEPRQGKDCAEEMEAILRIAKTTSRDSQITSRIVNATMNYRYEFKSVSALWLAATHENQAVVDFLLSLDETNAAQGITILQHTTYDPDYKRNFECLRLPRLYYYPTRASQGRSEPFLKAFDALSPNQAQQLLRSPGAGKWPWWFSCPFMLDELLRKCGRGNGGIQAQVWRRECTSLLRLFVLAVAVPSLNPYPLYLESSDIEKLFWALWEHGTKENNLRFMMKPINAAISSVPAFYSQRAYVGARERLRCWFSILNQLLRNNVKLDNECRKDLEECCNDLLGYRSTSGLHIRGVLFRRYATISTSYLRNARSARGVSRARNAWKKAVGDAKDSEIERADMIDLIWDFLDSAPAPNSNTVSSASRRSAQREYEQPDLA